MNALCCFFKSPCSGGGEASQSLIGTNEGSTPLSWKALQCTVGTIGVLGVILVIGSGAGLLGKAAIITLSTGITGTTMISCAVSRCVVKHLNLNKAVEDLEKQNQQTGDAILKESELLAVTSNNQQQGMDELQKSFVNP